MAAEFPPAGLPHPGDVALVTDELGAPADFLVHRVLAAHLKAPAPPLNQGRRPRAVVLSVDGDAERWKSVGAKSVGLFLFDWIRGQFADLER